MIKKIFAFIISAVILCTSVLCVSADAPTPNYTISAFPDGANQAVDAYGEFDNSVTKEDGLVIFRMMRKSDGTELCMRVTRTYKEDGKIKFNFGKILLPSTITTGTYIIEISGNDFSAKYRNENFDYALASDLLVILKKIDEYTKAADKKVADAYTATTAEDNSISASRMGFDMTEWNGFTDAGKNAYDAVMKAKTYTLPTTVVGATPDETAANTAQITAESANVKGYHKEASAVGVFVDIDDATELNAWHNKYYNDATVGVGEGVFDSYKIPAMTTRMSALMNNEEFVGRVSKISTVAGATAAEDIVKKLYENVVLTELVEAESNSAAETLLKNESKTSGNYLYGINWADYGRLSYTKQSNVLDKVKGDNAKGYLDAADAVTKINNVIDEERNAVEGGSDGGYSGPSYSGPTGGSIKVEIPSGTGNKTPFKDIENVEWAKEAIEYLYDLEVVNGVSKDSFAPNNNVTRAEFIKMVISAAGAALSTTSSPFKDVDNNSWYAPYVSEAYSEGIVLGDESGNFYPNAPITREDMVTILYRALGINTSGSAEFADSAQISDYAMNAVSYFSEKNVVNGLGDGRFGPKQNATRAQTATIIYRIMTMK